MGLNITYLQATEIIYRARGPEMEKSVYCHMSKIIQWFKNNLNMLRPVQKTQHHHSFNLTSNKPEKQHIKTRENSYGMNSLNLWSYIASQGLRVQKSRAKTTRRVIR